LFAWKIVGSFRPDDPEGLEKVEQLQKRIQNVADSHFQKGLDYLNNSSLPAARKEFLLVLAYDPENMAALEYLKTKTIEPDYTSYEIRQGDTISGIAKRIYGDSKRDFLVAYFNDLTSNDQFKPGMVLKLPILEAEPKREVRLETKRENKPRTASPPKAYDKARAEEHYRKGVNYFLAEDLQGAIREWEETLRLDPEHPNAKKDIEKARSLLFSMGSK
jgi:nucleoid-associated protein YgaU